MHGFAIFAGRESASGDLLRREKKRKRERENNAYDNSELG